MAELIEDRIFDMDRNEIDAYPGGVITLDRSGTILRFSKGEEQLARRDAATTLGLNFFSDVAPCTAVQDFKGRFDEFATKHDSGVDRFNFVFKFAWGKQDVSITMIRKAGNSDINLLVVRKSTPQT